MFGQSETNRSVQHARALLLNIPREVNNRLTGWVFAHLVNYFAHPVNSTCPLPITAHPVNYLAHRKMGTSIIETRQSRWKFLQNGQPKRWNTFSCTLNQKFFRNLLGFSLLDINKILQAMHDILYFVASDSIEKVKYLKRSQNFQGKTHNLGWVLEQSKIKICPPS